MAGTDRFHRHLVKDIRTTPPEPHSSNIYSEQLLRPFPPLLKLLRFALFSPLPHHQHSPVSNPTTPEAAPPPPSEPAADTVPMGDVLERRHRHEYNNY